MPHSSHPDRAKVVFVDDENDVLEGIRRSLLLQNVDWDLRFFSDPKLALADEDSLKSDVIVTDLRMPGLNGIELMKALRAKGMSAEIIVLTGTGDMGTALTAINELSAFRFYIKPCPQQRLVEGIKDAIDQRKASMAATDLLPFAVLGVDSGQRITFMNKEGATLVNETKLIVVDGAGRCRAATVAQTATLHNAIESVLKTGDATVLGLDDNTGETRFSVLIERAVGGSGNASAFLFISDPNKRRPPSMDALKQLFNFSNSEAKLAFGLAQGLDIKEVAENMEVTVQTARTYLRSLFEKTNTNRQADLVRTLITAIPLPGSIA